MTGRAERHYVSVDGGSGASLLGELRHANAALIEVSSPRHADMMIVVEPISSMLAPFVAEVYRALPRPRDALAVGRGDGMHGAARLENVVSSVRHVSEARVGAVMAAALERPSAAQPDDFHSPDIEPLTEALPSKHDRDMASELVVVALGPIQSITAGPLRLVLACDGEQIVSAKVDAAYAARDIAGAMLRASWADAARLAAELDPLAPMAGRLAFAAAVEQIEHRQPAPPIQAGRDAALALERAQNHLSWLERFAAVLAHDALADAAVHLGARLREAVLDLTGLSGLAREVEQLRARLAADRLLGSRTRRIGVLDRARADAARLTGPVSRGSIDGGGDVRSRLLVQLDDAIADLRHAADLGERRDIVRADWRVPAGEATATVRGPRGDIRVRVGSTGDDSPSLVEWMRPSATVLTIIPELLACQRLADAEIILASLDVATAEADG